ncbi:MAG: hypothetical protein CFE26_19005, partial [Verrucomicrobiales bacterium VVV1]
MRNHPLRFYGLFLGALCLCTLSEAKETKVDQALKTIREAESVTSGAVGEAGIKTAGYAAYEVVTKQATREQLLACVLDENVNLRAYAAMALKERFPREDFFELLMEKLKDESEFEYRNGCIGYRMKIGDLYHQTLIDSLSIDHQVAVIDHLLTTENKLTATDLVLRESDIPERHLPRLRTLAAAGNGSALLAVAKFRRDEDKPLIIASVKAHPFECFRCIAMNPQPEYFKVLQEAQQALLAETAWSTTQREFYTAAAAYRNKDSVDLFEKVVNGTDQEIPMRSYHLDFIVSAINAIEEPVYDELKWRLWGELQRINLSNFKRLVALDETRALKLTRQTLDSLSREVSNEVLLAMFALISPKDPNYVDGVIANELGKCELTRYSFLADIATKNPKDAYIEPLFKAVETSDNPWVYLPATETLVSYK